jgi:multiple sugar transport system substrate-binding protein
MARKIILSLRKTMTVISAASLLGLTAACSSPSANQPDNDNVEFRFSWWGNAGRAELTI